MVLIFFNRKLFEYDSTNNIFNYSLWRREDIFLDSINWLENNIENIDEIKTLHSFIWLSLTGYCLDDYDSVVLSYIIGCSYLCL